MLFGPLCASPVPAKRHAFQCLPVGRAGAVVLSRVMLRDGRQVTALAKPVGAGAAAAMDGKARQRSTTSCMAGLRPTQARPAHLTPLARCKDDAATKSWRDVARRYCRANSASHPAAHNQASQKLGGQAQSEAWRGPLIIPLLAAHKVVSPDSAPFRRRTSNVQSDRRRYIMPTRNEWLGIIQASRGIQSEHTAA